MNMEEELSKDCPETENIYSDIIEFDLGTEVEKLKEENSRLEDHIDSLQQDVEKLVEAVKWLKTLQDNLAENISSLFLTAQTELARKDRIIEDLRRKLDDIIFRRDVRKRKPELYSSPDHLSKRARFDPPINVADDRKTIHENNSHDYRGHNKNNFEKDNIDHFNIEERSNVVDEWNDRDGKHENDSTNSRAKSYGQNNTRMKNGNMYDRKEDRYIHSRKEDSRRGDRYSNHYRRTHDRKEFQRTESCQLPRKRNEIVEKETHTSDEEHNVQNECSRIPCVEIIKEIDFERKKLKNSNEENRKPVRKKLKAVQKLEQKMWEKKASIENMSHSKTKSIQKKPGNFFAENMNHIMDSVLIDINDTRLITVTKKEQEASSEEMFNESISSHSNSYRKDDKEEKGENRSTSHNLKDINLRFAKEESEAVVESQKEISDIKEMKENKDNQNKITDKPLESSSEKNINTEIKLCHIEESKSIMSDTNKIERKVCKLNILNDATSFTETIIENSFSCEESITDSQQKNSATNDEQVNNLSINNDVFSHEVKSHIEIHTQIEKSEFKVQEKNMSNDNRKNPQQNISRDKKIENQNSQSVEEEHVKKNKSSENLSDNFGSMELKKEITEINDETIIKSTLNEKQKILANDREKKLDLPDVDIKKALEENEETNSSCKRKRELSASPKVAKLNPQYKIPKKEKQSVETDSSIQKCDDSESQRNIVLVSNEDHKSSYEGRHRNANRTKERYQKSRPKSVPRSFIERKSEEREHRARSGSRGRHMRRDNLEERRETYRHEHNNLEERRKTYRHEHNILEERRETYRHEHNNLEERRETYRHEYGKQSELRFRTDNRMNIYSRRKSFSGESEYRKSIDKYNSRNHNEKSHFSLKNHESYIRDPRRGRSKSRNRIDGASDEIRTMETNLERTRVISLQENDDSSEKNNIYEHVKKESNKCKRSHQTIECDSSPDPQKDTSTKNRVTEKLEKASTEDGTETKCSTKKSKEGMSKDCTRDKDLEENTAKTSILATDRESEDISTNFSKEKIGETDGKKLIDVKLSCDDVATEKQEPVSPNKVHDNHNILGKNLTRKSECEEKETKSIQGKYKNSVSSEKENLLLIKASCSENDKDTKKEELFENSSETKDNLPPKRNSDERIEINKKKIKQTTDKKPVEKDDSTTGANDKNNPESLIRKNVIETAVSQKIKVKRLPEKAPTETKDSLNNQVNICSRESDHETDFERLHETNSMEKPEKKCAFNKQERVIDSESNEHPLAESSDSKVDTDENLKDSSSHKRKRENGELLLTNNLKYSSDIRSSEICSKNIETETLINNKEMRNMPDILPEDSNPQPVPNLIPLNETLLEADKLSKDNVRSKRRALQNKSVKHQKSKTIEEKFASVEVSEKVTKNEDEARGSEPPKISSVKVPPKVKDSVFSSKNSLNVECSGKCIPKSDELNVDINQGNSVVDQVPVRKRITPIRIDDSPICTFENILEKNRMPSFAKDLSAPNASPLTLTHDGDIPLLHLEENHFQNLNDDGTQRSFDRNIINLLDTMNMSNLECDITKFQVSSDKDDKPQSVNESAVNQENGEIPVSSTKIPDVVLPKTGEPTVSTTLTTQNEIAGNKSSCSNNVHNIGDGNAVQETGSNSGTPVLNLSRVGRRRRVRLVVID